MTTNIKWTDETWNPLVGCSKISPGCANCYAATAAKSARLQQFPQYQAVGQWDGTIQFVSSQLEKPLHWKKPRRVFVCSMSDLFHQNAEIAWIDRIFAVMALSPQHTFQLLTKRPANMLEYLENPHRIDAVNRAIGEWSHCWDITTWPLPNVWVGTTVESREVASRRMGLLWQIPAAVRFLSCEPLLGKIDLDLKDIHWVIAGGESGVGYRPVNPDWVRHIRDQCDRAGVPFFFKQWGGRTSNAGGNELDGRIHEEFPEIKSQGVASIPASRTNMTLSA